MTYEDRCCRLASNRSVACRILARFSRAQLPSPTDGLEPAAELGQLVVDAWRDRGEHRTRDKAVPFQSAQCQRQHAL